MCSEITVDCRQNINNQALPTKSVLHSTQCQGTKIQFLQFDAPLATAAPYGSLPLQRCCNFPTSCRLPIAFLNELIESDQPEFPPSLATPVSQPALDSRAQS
jgi:hypothetical protein